MKVFKVWVDDYDYDEFDSAIIVAESAEEIRANFTRDEFNDRVFTGTELFFTDKQGEIRIKEVDINHAGLLLSSFNAG